MITIQSKAHVGGVRAQHLIEFLLRCDDTRYQRWWPGTHLRFYTLGRGPGDGLFFSADFERALDEHVRTEFPRLGTLLCTATAP